MILVTGGAGVLGSRLVHGLASRGHKIRVLTLPGDPYVSRLEGLDCEIFYGDIADSESIQGACDGVTTIYHLAAIIITPDLETLRRVNVGGTINLVKSAEKAGVNHFVYVSSASADEPSGSEYARSKIEAEQAVRSQSKMKTTIVRPTLIYDSQGGQEFMMFFDSLLKYPVVPFVGSGKVKKRPVYSEDIVTGLLAIVGNERSYGKSYDFSGGEEISMRHLAHLLLEIVGRKKIIIPVPIFICNIIALLMEKSMSHPPLTRYAISRIVHETAFDHSSAQEDLGYNPIRVSEGLKLCNFSDRT